MTGGSSITNGDLDFTNAYSSKYKRDYTSSIPRGGTLHDFVFNPTANSWSGFQYLYFAVPERVYTADVVNQIKNLNFYINGSTTPGAMSLQGFDNAADAKGLSTIDVINAEGYSERYRVWRTDQTFEKFANGSNTCKVT